MSHYSQAVLKDQPVGYWPLDETTGTTVRDASGNGNHGTLHGGVNLGQEGAFPGSHAPAFDGKTGYLEIDTGTWGGSRELTVEAWVQVEQTSGDFEAIVSSLDAGQFVHLQLHNLGAIAVYTNGGSFPMPILSQEPLAKWRHIALVITPGASRIYVDGKEVSSRDFNFSKVNPTSKIHIGNGYRNGRFLNGKIDQVAIYNSALSPQQIEDHLNAAQNSTQEFTVCTSGCPFTTIQAAVDAAVPGGVVLVAGETFHESGITINKEVTIQGQGRDATLVDGGGQGRVFNVSKGGNLTLRGITARNGSGNETGSALAVVGPDAMATIEESRFVGPPAGSSVAAYRDARLHMGGSEVQGGLSVGSDGSLADVTTTAVDRFQVFAGEFLDDLKTIEGVGPKTADVLERAGIDSFHTLAATSVDRLREVLIAAGGLYRLTDPSSWPQQAALAAAGKTAELKALQDELIAGRRKA